MTMWFERPLVSRAPSGGMQGVDDHFYKGGEFMPFYIPRGVMPQVDEKDLNELFDFLETNGIKVVDGIMLPSFIRPHQRIDHDKARHMDEATLKKPALISEDRFIIDGNHRWWEHKELGSPLATFSIMLPFEKAVAAVFLFPKTYYYADGKAHPITR